MDIVTILVTLFILAATFLLLHYIIRSAVRGALIDAYKTTRLYERTGEWITGPFDNKAAPRHASEDKAAKR